MIDYSEFIHDRLEAAARIAKDSFGKVLGNVKPGDNNQVLTQTDLDIGRMIIERIRRQFPEHNIIDEEAGVIDNNSRYTWVIDPIDGTSNFAAGLSTYGSMFGLLEDGCPVAGGVVLPYFDEIYVARKGQGAFCNNHKMSVTKERDLKNMLIAFGIDTRPADPDRTRRDFQLLAEIVLRTRNIRSSNSVFDIMHVATGAYGAWLGTDSKIWDNVSPQIIIEESGGVYTDLFGQPLDYSQSLTRLNQNFTFCAASPVLHKQIQRIIKISKPHGKYS